MVGSNATRTCRAQVFSGGLQHFKRRPRAWSRPASQLAASKQGKQGGQGSIHFQVKVNASPSAPTQQAQASGYTVLFEDVIRQTQLGIALYDITEDVEKVLAKSQVKEGCVNVISRHTTTALTINELEPRLVEDVRQFLQKLVPPSYPYLVSAAISFCFFSLLLSLSLFLSLSLSLSVSLSVSLYNNSACAISKLTVFFSLLSFFLFLFYIFSFEKMKHNDLQFRDIPDPFVGVWPDDEPINAHSHIIGMLMGQSESVPVHEGKLVLGTYQSIIFLELDGPRERKIGVQVTGLK